MQKKLLVLGLAALMTAGAANAELKAFKVNGETVSVAEQKAIYDRAVRQGQPASPELERQVKNALIQQTVLLQEAKKAKLENRADVKEAINAAREQVLINALIQDWAKANPVSDKDVKEAYDRQKAAYGDTEYQVRHILVKTEEQAKNLIKRLGNKGANFDKLAQEFSEDTGNKNQGGLLGWVVPRSYPAAFGVAFSALKPGEVAQTPIRTQYGFHVVKLDAKRPAQLFPAYESQAPQLKNALTNLAGLRPFCCLRRSRPLTAPSFPFRLLRGLDERFGHQRIAVDELKVLHHQDRPFLVLLEVGGPDVVLVGRVVRVDLENSELRRILLFLHAVENANARFVLHRFASDFRGEDLVGLDLRGIDRNLGEPHDVAGIGVRRRSGGARSHHRGRGKKNAKESGRQGFADHVVTLHKVAEKYY